jgi:Arc/MetJ family transcription regulator
MHIELDDEVVREVDRLAGPRERSAFVRRAVLRALEDAQRAAALRSAAGSLSSSPTEDTPHEWDADTAGWVRAQRRSSDRRAG